MALTAEEQLFLELTNRARLDPLGEAALYGIDLNEDLAPGTITGDAKQVVAYNPDLDQAATGHSLWMLQTSTFSHTGRNGSSLQDRLNETNYVFENAYGWGENLSLFQHPSQPINPALSPELHHKNLFKSESHRVNTMREFYQEAGFSIEAGTFNGNHATVATQNYAFSGTNNFLTGVVYHDQDNNDFYSIGEGRSGISFAAQGSSTSTSAAGGYTLEVTPGSAVTVTFQQGKTATVDMSQGNVKLDFVNGDLLLSSGTLDLGAGITRAKLLGVADLDLTGTDTHDRLTGNKGDNIIRGGAGYDTIIAGEGNDIVHGGDGRDVIYLNQGNDTFFDTTQGGYNGADVVFAGLGNDTIQGGNGQDTYYGEDGNDVIFGRLGDDVIFGGTGADTIHGNEGNDRVHGGDGRDTVYLGQGNDTFFDTPQGGFNGTDTVFAGLGDDTIQGGNGNDIYRGEGGNDVIFGRLGNDMIFGGDQFDTIYGGEGNDTIDGGFGRDVIFMNQGDDTYIDNAQGGDLGVDTVFAGLGNDTIQGGGGNDRFFGEAGADVIFGGLGNDLINGGTGADTLTGGAGQDTFVFKVGDGADHITDFAVGIDTLQLDDALTGGNQNAANVVATYASVAGNSVIFDFGGTTIQLEGVSSTNGLADDLTFF